MNDYNTNSNTHLNDFILEYLQSDGIEYVAINYIELRNDYYAIKEAG